MSKASGHLQKLPLVFVNITDGCNSRCITCDIWKSPRRNISLELVEKIASEFDSLGVECVGISGGEALQHPEWKRIAKIIKKSVPNVFLITNGLLLRKYADQILESFDSVLISLDAATPKNYAAIRGVNALPVILEGIKILSKSDIEIRTRTTIQRLNFREIPQIVDLALNAGASSTSFLTVDFSSAESFGRRSAADSAILKSNFSSNSVLTKEELPEFSKMLDQFELSHAEQFISKQIFESPVTFRYFLNYFAAANGLMPFVAPLCNAPKVSTVIEVDGTLRPCFFLPHGAKVGEASLKDSINHSDMLKLRRNFQNRKMPQCERCVCPQNWKQ